MTSARSIGDMERPLCKCHGDPMCWCKDAHRKAGGYWRCAVKRRERNRIENMTPEQIERVRERNREHQREYRAKAFLLKSLPDRLHILEMTRPKEVAIARLAIGGTTASEREVARKKLDQLLAKERKGWLSPLIINCAMRTTRHVASSPLCLVSSRGD